MGNIANGWVWFGFSIFLIFALTADTFLLKKYVRPHESMRIAICWSLLWITCAFIFNGLLWVYLYVTADPALANSKALDFLTGYLIEKSLSIDNLFAFFVIFTQLQIPHQYQHRVFSYGIWSAVILRLLVILAFTWLVLSFHWILYLMGIFLLITGIKICITEEKEKTLSDTFVFKILKKTFRFTHEFHGQAFFVRQKGLLYATPLFIALIFIEVSDLIFAVDSIPAIFAITQDPFIVWSSNIFAILGLRALYFVLAGMVHRFHLLKFGVGLIIIFVGFKMVIAPWWHISVGISLAVIASLLTLFTVLSLFQAPRKDI